MDSDSISLILSIIVLILLSAYFSASETAFSCLNKVRLKSMAADGNKAAARALRVSEQYDEMLSTILVGNNIVNITMASLGTILFTIWFAKNGVTVSTVVITVVVLIFGEISPKSMAKESPEAFAMFSAPFLGFLIKLFFPINRLFGGWKKLLNMVFKAGKHHGVTEDELITYVDEAQSGGNIDEHEGELLRAAIEFNDLDVSDILTPRVDIEAVSDEMSMEDISDRFRQTEYSRLPVYHDTIDHIIGVIHEKNFRRAYEQGEAFSESFIGKVFYTSENTKISSLLRSLQGEKIHMAIVVDEFGGTVGLITMEDILEELVGEIWDEHDEIVEDFKKLEENLYRVRCSANLTDMLELFQIDAEFDCSTVSGWVIQQLEKIPVAGDHFTYENLEVTVLSTELRRVLEIQVKVNPRITSEEED